jgi:hypothetical protein
MLVGVHCLRPSNHLTSLLIALLLCIGLATSCGKSKSDDSDGSVIEGCLETPNASRQTGSTNVDSLVESAKLVLYTDPGPDPWQLVPRNRVAAECGLDPDLLDDADADPALNASPYAIIRYGRLCHEYYPSGTDQPDQLASATKTLGAVVTGIASYESRNLPCTGRKSGPLSDKDRVDRWLDDFSFNKDAQIGHVLAMVAHNEDLSYDKLIHEYDGYGSVQINRLSDVINTVIQQDRERLGGDIEEFTQKFLFGPLGMKDSIWNDGLPDKVLGVTWQSTIQDMARLGLLILNDGVWDGRRVLASSWVEKMTHPAFEAANTSYGYLTWLSARSNFHMGGFADFHRWTKPFDKCAPAAIWSHYPHGLSEATDCEYFAPDKCEQKYDVGVWYANGAGGNLIVGHPGLDMVLVVKKLGNLSISSSIGDPIMPALVALDPKFTGDVVAFCDAYGKSEYAPDLR